MVSDLVWFVASNFSTWVSEVQDKGGWIYIGFWSEYSLGHSILWETEHIIWIIMCFYATQHPPRRHHPLETHKFHLALILKGSYSPFSYLGSYLRKWVSR
jgi:hypothetical protein